MLIRRPARKLTMLLCFSLCLTAGCGGDPLGRHALSGKVTLDGTPVENGTISFVPIDQGATSSGATVAGGEYTIPRESGLPAGRYRVTINAPKPGTGQAAAEDVLPGDPLPVAEELIPAEWNVSSDKTIEVREEGPFDFNFDVKLRGSV